MKIYRGYTLAEFIKFVNDKTDLDDSEKLTYINYWCVFCNKSIEPSSYMNCANKPMILNKRDREDRFLAGQVVRETERWEAAEARIIFQGFKSEELDNTSVLSERYILSTEFGCKRLNGDYVDTYGDLFNVTGGKLKMIKGFEI